MVWEDVENEMRSRLAETTTVGFWTSRDLQRYFNNGMDIQHQAVYQGAAELERKGFSQAYENDYMKTWLRQVHFVTTAGIQDYSLPSDLWRVARVVIGLSPPYQAEMLHWNDDYQARLGGRMGPSIRKPLYSLVPTHATSLLRLYVHPGDRTVPNASIWITVHYFAKPIQVNQSASPPIDSDLDYDFIAGPVAYGVYLALLKERTAGQEFRQEFDTIVKSLVPGSSKETE